MDRVTAAAVELQEIRKKEAAAEYLAIQAAIKKAEVSIAPYAYMLYNTPYIFLLYRYIR